MHLADLFTLYLLNVITVFIVSMCYNLWVVRVSHTPKWVQESEQYMEKTREKHLEQINQCLDRIELDLIRKSDSEDLEFKWEELVAKLEQIHDEMRELKDEVADIKNQVDDVENGDWS